MKIDKSGKVSDPGSREGVAKVEGFPLEIEALTCVRVRNHEKTKNKFESSTQTPSKSPITRHCHANSIPSTGQENNSSAPPPPPKKKSLRFSSFLTV